ncbi:glycosyltransferase family 2 protein [Streptomyces purpureus]|uniref:Transferase n=1 Tax=Streptomyces purpureus TaxID=1951 RepID=A0A918H8I1_9ACTN|nr:glycosyltransferase [Streptomyces purpureus]GGT46133.1 transferase [Streptomyces purpureus]
MTKAAQQTAPAYAVVIPTLGRPSLQVCLRALASARGPKPVQLVLVDDRPQTCNPALSVDSIPPVLRQVTTVVAGGARGPAAARNTGWRAADPVPWIVFLDDDVIPGPSWGEDLERDLSRASYLTAGVTARITVPLPADRAPTDWERNTSGLATARWITADMAYRRDALLAVGGFDERFRRAFREDADLALRVQAAGWSLSTGTRRTTHPVRPADRWISVRLQAGNSDDVLMNRLHGRDWWGRAAAPRGRLPGHLAVTGAALASVSCAVLGRRTAATACAAGWAAGTAEFAAARIRPGPRTRDEIVTMLLTSVLIPPTATWHWLRGYVRHRRTPPWAAPGTAPRAPRTQVRDRVGP